MNPQIQATEFELCVSMGDLVLWSEDSDDPVALHPDLQALFDALGADIDLLPIICGYFEDGARVGRGDVYVFEIDDATVVALDTYSEPTDQLDLISLYIRCGKDKSAEIARLALQLFNATPCQVYFAQKSISSELREAIDARNFPRSFPGSSFRQSQIRSALLLRRDPIDRTPT